MGTLLNIFAMLAIYLKLGLYGLSAFMAEQRTKDAIIGSYQAHSCGNGDCGVRGMVGNEQMANPVKSLRNE